VTVNIRAIDQVYRKHQTSLVRSLVFYSNFRAWAYCLFSSIITAICCFLIEYLGGWLSSSIFQFYNNPLLIYLRSKAKHYRRILLFFFFCLDNICPDFSHHFHWVMSCIWAGSPRSRSSWIEMPYNWLSNVWIFGISSINSQILWHDYWPWSW